MPVVRPAALIAMALACAACRAPEPPPTDKPPEPQATAAATPSHTELRDAIQAPQDKARATEATIQQAADKQRDAIDAAAQ
ncbi:hypothetical protein [Pseudoxanthomonas putridarboris]|uniref:Lipoprotein n=1 Tax=Pseudoxanthomonas putridarboris TaxID=752605 RepID=A0ABU9IVX2_9GAMM